jgi:uncharacterized Fe-S cluster-containing radical SAM superfamily protein
MTSIKNKLIKTEVFSAELRRRGIDAATQRILVTKFPGSQQAADLSLPPNCGGFGRIHHFRKDQGVGWPRNPLPIDVAANFFHQPPPETMEVQVFQNAICSWRCWYCYVDFDLLSANKAHSEFKTVAELLDLYEMEGKVPRVMDLSGGQPDLVPEWSLWMADELNRRGKSSSVFLWSDDNLSNDYLWRYLSAAELKRLTAQKNYARVGCFKGFDEHSFSFNTTAEPQLFLQQFELMRRLVVAGFDVYGYVTLTSDNDSSILSKMKRFIDLLQEKVSPIFPLRLVPLRIYPFSPMIARVKEQQERAMAIQEEAVKAFVEEMESRFPLAERSRPIVEHRLI